MIIFHWMWFQIIDSLICGEVNFSLIGEGSKNFLVCQRLCWETLRILGVIGVIGFGPMENAHCWHIGISFY